MVVAPFGAVRVAVRVVVFPSRVVWDSRVEVWPFGPVTVASRVTVLPSLVQTTWAEFLDHESMRLWITTPMLSTIWGLGYYAFNRLIVNPTPPIKSTD